MKKSSQSLGGIAYGKIQRDNAIKKYNLSPKYCKFCSSKIEIDDQKVSIINRKIFCNRSCSASFNNNIPKRIKVKHKCLNCSENLSSKATKRCIECYSKIKHLFWLKLKHEVTHAQIREHARRSISNRHKICAHCGYSKFVECCHIKPVSSFLKTDPIYKINHKDNLLWLCPNCHWEFDNKK